MSSRLQRGHTLKCNQRQLLKTSKSIKALNLSLKDKVMSLINKSDLRIIQNESRSHMID